MFLSFADAKNIAEILSEASGSIQNSQGVNLLRQVQHPPLLHQVTRLKLEHPPRNQAS